MKDLKTGKTYLIRVYKGSELTETLLRFVKDNNIASASVSGIGAADDVTIGYYNTLRKEYVRKHFREPMEILNVSGNIAVADGEPVAHLHILLGDEKFQVFGGHLFSANISVTCEIYLNAYDAKIERKLDPDTQLKLLDI